MSPIHTRPAQRVDLPRLSAMISALAAQHGDTATLDINALQRDIFGAQPWVRISVALITHDIVGYAALSPQTKLQFCARGMDIQHMFIEAEHRRKGIGRALIEDAIKRSKEQECSYLTIGTAPDNTAAQQAYRACGFRVSENDPTKFKMMLSQ